MQLVQLQTLIQYLNHSLIYKNLNDQGQVINSAESDGLPDRFIPKSDAAGFKSSELTFREYEFNMEDLPPFKFYRVKFVLTSTNQTICS